MFGRDNTPSSGLPGAGPSGLGSTSANVSLGKPSNSPVTPAQPSGPWELGRWSMLIFLAVALAAATFGFAADRRHREHDPLDQAARGAITATSALSFTRADRLRLALDAIRAKAPKGATILSLTIEPTKVDGSLLASDGQDLYTEIDAALKPVVRGTSSGSDMQGIAFSSFPTAAPARILAAAEQRLHLQPANLERFSISASGQPGVKPGWNVSYSKPYTHNSAAAAFDGTDVRFQGTPDAATRKIMRDSQRRVAAAQRAAERALRGLNR